ncbi:hypothetical protein DSO57_1004707 [Entomophthora muscae]|uniref:Uncharacterized protein n=1 Tax=Entomophthora muscae TaxID=34485 RepID=A0ACC2SXC7_9FUNG|nr:hypothetical protein DSO57_1004707 [Entomophthora muscae]
MVFKKIGCESKNSFFSAVLHFQDDIPSKTPLLSSNQEANHMSQFKDFFNTNVYKFAKIIPRFTCLDAIENFTPDLCKETFKATTVFLGVPRLKLTLVFKCLASCFPNLEELGIYATDFKANYDETRESKLTFELWEKLIDNCPNLSKIHLSKEVPFRCQVEEKYPHLSVDNKR